ncbi:MAG TPA: GNAT family N-acetyltransferase, partial [Actinopolymorphaceae bacterium]|nr:GNAT family N-acetyltransferase [Actinopolymorphaceae bacterium]
MVEQVKDQSWALLVDGTVVSVRPVQAADKQAIAELHNAMSPDNRYLRFFGFSPDASRRLAENLCGPAPRRTDGRCALGVWQAGELLGVAHYEVDPANRLEAEIALAVADRAHSKGIGTLLLEHLASRARAAGIARFTADVLARNAPMLRVFADAGLRIVEHRDHDVMEVVASLEVSEAYLDSIAGREAIAQTASLQHVLAPQSVVVVGASERAGNIGGLVVRNLVKAGFLGRVDVVHPVAGTVFGVQAWKSLADLPSPPELAVVAVPARAVAETVESCGRLGVRAIVVLTAGIDAGAGRDILDRCRHYGMRLVGPNCLGVAVPNRSLDVTFTAHRLRGGVAGVAVQSGGVGIAVTDQLNRLGIGVSSLVSLGDKLDVSATDLMQHWSNDHGTELALLYIESFGNPRKFARAAARLSRRIPVLAVDGGRSAPAQRAAISHTAAAATPTAARQALFVDAGIIAVNDMGDLVATAALLATQPLPSGRRVAVVSNAGGAGILLADACADAGLELPPLSAPTIERLAEILPRGATFTNPVDASAGCDRTALAEAVVALAADPAIDAIL